MNIMLEQMTVQKSFGHSELNDEDNLSAALKQKKRCTQNRPAQARPW